MPVKLIVLDMAGTTVADKDFVVAAFKSALENQDIVISTADINPLRGMKRKRLSKWCLKNTGSILIMN